MKTRTLVRLAFAVLALGSAGPLPLAAQEAPVDTLRLSELRTPSSPAFALLGVTPTTIARPSTPRAFALSLLSAGNAAGILPDSYAAEFAPYWMGSRRELEFREYFHPTLLQSLRQTLSLSFATAQNPDDAGDPLTNVALGFRTTPFPGEATERMDSLVEALRGAQRARVEMIFRRRDAEAAGNAATVAALNDSLTAQAAEQAALAREVLAEDQTRVGFVMEVAGGLTGVYPDVEFERGRVGRYGAWSTLGYRLESPRVDLLGLGRWQRDEANTDGQHLWDVGGRAVLTLERFAASAEFVRRTTGDAPAGTATPYDDSNRYVAILEYRATEDLFFTFSFGSDHPLTGGDRNPLVAILGTNFHWGSTPVIPLAGR